MTIQLRSWMGVSIWARRGWCGCSSESIPGDGPPLHCLIDPGAVRSVRRTGPVAALDRLLFDAHTRNSGEGETAQRAARARRVPAGMLDVHRGAQDPRNGHNYNLRAFSDIRAVGGSRSEIPGAQGAQSAASPWRSTASAGRCCPIRGFLHFAPVYGQPSLSLAFMRRDLDTRKASPNTSLARPWNFFARAASSKSR